MILIVLCSILGLGYFSIISIYWFGWNSIALFSIPKDFKPTAKLTIIIPARNEAENIALCINAVIKNNYPKELLEVIIINDFSEDETAEIAMSFSDKINIQILNLSDFAQELEGEIAYKKIGIEKAVALAKGEIMVISDADCEADTDWLYKIAAYFKTHQNIVGLAGPVNFYKESNKLERFQSLDFTGMMCVTGAGLKLKFSEMGNGANLSFLKTAFNAVNGYEGVKNHASGDDVFLIHKLTKQFPQGIDFLKTKGAVVNTKGKPDWNSFINQRIRWATKNGSYQKKSLTIILAIIFLYCNLIIALPFFALIGGVNFLYGFAFLFGLKFILDYFFLRKMTTFFNRKELMKGYYLSQIYHIFYIVLIGWMANVNKTYTWKGRKVH